MSKYILTASLTMSDKYKDTNAHSHIIQYEYIQYSTEKHATNNKIFKQKNKNTRDLRNTHDTKMHAVNTQ